MSHPTVPIIPVFEDPEIDEESRAQIARAIEILQLALRGAPKSSPENIMESFDVLFVALGLMCRLQLAGISAATMRRITRLGITRVREIYENTAEVSAQRIAFTRGGQG